MLTVRSCRILPEGSSQIWMPWSCVAVAASFPEGEMAQRTTCMEHLTPSYLFTCIQPVGNFCSSRKTQQPYSNPTLTFQPKAGLEFLP